MPHNLAFILTITYRNMYMNLNFHTYTYNLSIPLAQYTYILHRNLHT